MRPEEFALAIVVALVFLVLVWSLLLDDDAARSFDEED